MELRNSRLAFTVYLLGVITLVITGTGMIQFGSSKCMCALTDGSTGKGNTYNVNTILYSSEVLDKAVCNVPDEGMDLMKMEKLPFIKKYKNPCWYQGGTLQCLPYMYLIGVAKCGSGDLFRKLGIHPDFVKPATKENNWLSYGRFARKETFSYYTSTFFSPLSKMLLKSKSTNLITGDFSINIMEGPVIWQCLQNNVGHNEPVEGNPEYIYHLNNQARIITNVRNPIDRLWSEYLHFSSNKNKSAERFHKLVKSSIHMYRECIRSRTLRSCMYDRPLANLAAISEEVKTIRRRCLYRPDEIFYLARGVYYVYIKDYLKVFPRHQVLIQRVEDFAVDMEKALKRTYTFLGLRIPSTDMMGKILSTSIVNSRLLPDREKGDMLESTRSILYEFYKPYNEQLAVLLNNSKYNYGIRG